MKKNTHPTDANGHRPRLTPELHRFIQHMGGYFENVGVPRIGGLILGLLIVAHEPLSAEDIASILKVSRASISTNFQILASTGLAERFTSHARRVTCYAFPDSAWEQILHMGIQRARVFKRIVHEGLAALPEKDVSHQRLELADDYTNLLMKWYEKMIVEWRAHYQRPSRLASTR